MHRNKGFMLRLTQSELDRLNRSVARTQLSREGYVRTLLMGYDPPAAPPEKYWTLIRKLWDIGSELEKIGRTAKDDDSDACELIGDCRRRLVDTICALQTIAVPEKSKDRKCAI